MTDLIQRVAILEHKIEGLKNIISNMLDELDLSIQANKFIKAMIKNL